MPDPVIPSARAQLSDTRTGLITRDWFLFLEALLNMARNSDFYFNVARGQVPGMSSVIVWGRAPAGVQTTATDVWDRADATPTQQIWLAPTAARVHAIVSSNVNDDGSPAGTGARTVTVYGLTSWSSSETSEVVTMDGVNPVNTANSYVTINKMVVTTHGSAGPNVGTITATAAVDATITAVIRPGIGQSQMAIYGIPSTQSAYITKVHTSTSSGVTTRVDFSLVKNIDPANFPAIFGNVRTLGDQIVGTNTFTDEFSAPLVIPGPCILKLQGIGASADVDSMGGFDLVLVNK